MRRHGRPRPLLALAALLLLLAPVGPRPASAKEAQEDAEQEGGQQLLEEQELQPEEEGLLLADDLLPAEFCGNASDGGAAEDGEWEWLPAAEPGMLEVPAEVSRAVGRGLYVGGCVVFRGSSDSCRRRRRLHVVLSHASLTTLQHHPRRKTPPQVVNATLAQLGYQYLLLPEEGGGAEDLARGSNDTTWIPCSPDDLLVDLDGCQQADPGGAWWRFWLRFNVTCLHADDPGAAWVAGGDFKDVPRCSSPSTHRQSGPGSRPQTQLQTWRSTPTAPRLMPWCWSRQRGRSQSTSARWCWTWMQRTQRRCSRRAPTRCAPSASRGAPPSTAPLPSRNAACAA